MIPPVFLRSQAEYTQCLSAYEQCCGYRAYVNHCVRCRLRRESLLAYGRLTEAWRARP